MNPLSKTLIYIAVVLICGIVFSPIAYWISQWIIAHGLLGFLEGQPFHRYFSRTIQVAGLIFLWPLIQWLDINSFRQLGIDRNVKAKQDLLFGFLLASVPMIFWAIGCLCVGVYRLRPEPDWIVLFRVVGTAAVVSIIEEFFFRAVLLGLAVRSLGRSLGLWISTVIFAGIHFCRPSREPINTSVTWLSGWDQLATIGDTAPPWPILIWGIITLLLVGLILGAATLRTRSLWLSIGLHAGWIFTQQAFSLFAKFAVKPQDALLPWIGPNLVSGMVPTGWVPIIILVVTGAGVGLYLSLTRERISKMIVS